MKFNVYIKLKDLLLNFIIWFNFHYLLKMINFAHGRKQRLQ